MKFPLPDAVLDSDIAILGRKGGGKTITAKLIAERLLTLKRRVLILDPLSIWHGLRSSRDGKSAGFPVAIFGGEHADYPLDPLAAKAFAEVIARENLPAILDIADLSKSAQQSFLTKFLQELRRVNRDPLTIVLEEADVFAPQSPQGDDSKALHAEIDWIARRGRSRGFRLVTVCQRPARLAKDVLTQASVLISHVLPSSHDRDAVKAWVDGNGDPEKAREVYKTLASLHVGEAWIWSTVQDAAFLKRAQFPMISTLDTSSTPKAGERKIEQKTIADVDVSAIKAALEKAKAPKLDRKELHKPGVVISAVDGVKIDAAVIRGQKEGYAAAYAEFMKLLPALSAAIAQAAATDTEQFLKRFTTAIDKEIAKIFHIPKRTRGPRDVVANLQDPANLTLPSQELIKSPERYAVRLDKGGLDYTFEQAAAVDGPASFHADLNKAQTAIMESLAFWSSVGNATPTRAQVAAVSGYSVRSSHFANMLSDLKTSLRIKYQGDGIRALVYLPGIPAETARSRFFATLEARQRSIVTSLSSTSPQGRDELAEAVEMSPTSSHYSNMLSGLRTLDVINRGDPIALTDWARQLIEAR